VNSSSAALRFLLYRVSAPTASSAPPSPDPPNPNSAKEGKSEELTKGTPTLAYSVQYRSLRLSPEPGRLLIWRTAVRDPFSFFSVTRHFPYVLLLQAHSAELPLRDLSRCEGVRRVFGGVSAAPGGRLSEKIRGLTGRPCRVFAFHTGGNQVRMNCVEAGCGHDVVEALHVYRSAAEAV